MRRKLEVTASEMLELRRQGYDNKQIAEQLEVSYATVWRYIGKSDVERGNIICEESQIAPEKKEPKVVVLSETIAVNSFIFRKEGGLLSVMTGGEDQYLMVPVDKAEEFSEAWIAAKKHFSM